MPFVADVSEGKEKVNSMKQQENEGLYFRGRQVYGEEVCYEELVPAIISGEENIEEGKERYVGLKERTEVGKVVTYEREGNESRRKEETSKAYEMVKLNKYVHE